MPKVGEVSGFHNIMSLSFMPNKTRQFVLAINHKIKVDVSGLSGAYFPVG